MQSQLQVYKFGALYCWRQKLYRKLMCRIQSFVVGLKKEERKLKLDAVKAKDPFDRKEGRKILVPKHLKYPLLASSQCAEEEPEPPGDMGVEVKMHPIHMVWCKDGKEWAETRKVQEFLKHLRWQEAETGEGGITWLELFALLLRSWRLQGGGGATH